MPPRSRRRQTARKSLPQFLGDFAQKHGDDALVGAILLLRLKRPIDDLISFALGLGPQHPGHPSPWSHNVLVTAPFDPANPGAIPILDCTIRDKNGNVAWDEPLEDFLGQDLTKQGGIYSGKVSDYDDKRVTLYGIKFFKTLSRSDRDGIVRAGLALQAKGYHYDIPGLFRELCRLLFHVAVPPTKGLLFCSAFCQKAYVDYLGSTGAFARGVIPEDTTDDEIWFSSVGTCYPLAVPIPVARRRAVPSSQNRKK